EFEETATDALILNISGPMAIFEQAQSYGMRLCQFFPYVLLCSKWEVEALVRLGEKSYQLKVDSSRPIDSHYRSFTGYIPEEFKEFISVFNEMNPSDRRGWLVEEGREHINLGRQIYSIPDLSLRHETGAVVHVELFHRWHETELRRRIQILKETTKSSLIIGASKELVKQAELEGLLAQGKETGLSIFTFRQFPTAKAILTYLPKV
ncbi:MAG: DUF790 family protein, partial [Proteobacteria bacterium]|nr:DUF790 family protein [Pseudomonadota bacterium]